MYSDGNVVYRMPLENHNDNLRHMFNIFWTRHVFTDKCVINQGRIFPISGIKQVKNYIKPFLGLVVYHQKFTPQLLAFSKTSN